jgi:hypothetical protein
METTESSHTPVAEQLPPARAFALMVETACDQFEVLQSLLRKEITVITSEQSDDIRKGMRLNRAPFCINMALAKSFVANLIRARRICEHGSQHLVIDRVERKRFLSNTSGIQKVRDVNEHGFDIKDNKNRPALHYNGGGFVDETAMYIGSAEEILMGPINLYDVYRAVVRIRDLAGFASLHRAEMERSSAQQSRIKENKPTDDVA